MNKNTVQTISEIIRKQKEAEVEEQIAREIKSRELEEKELEHQLLGYCWIIHNALGFSSNIKEENYKSIDEVREYIINLWKELTNIKQNNNGSYYVEFCTNKYDSNYKEFQQLEEFIKYRLSQMISDREAWLEEIGNSIWTNRRNSKLPNHEVQRIEIQMSQFKDKYDLDNDYPLKNLLTYITLLENNKI